MSANVVGKFNVESLGETMGGENAFWKFLITEFPGKSYNLPEIGHKCFYFAGASYLDVAQFLNKEENVAEVYRLPDASKIRIRTVLEKL